MSSIAASLISTSLLFFLCYRGVAKLLCVYWYVAIKPTVNLKKVRRRQTFMVEGDSLRNSLLLLWVRNEGLWLCLQLVWWTLRNNNMVTAAMMLSSIIFQKLNTGWEKNVFVPRSSSVSWINKKINVNRLRIIKSKLLQLCSHAEYKYLIVSIWRWGFFGKVYTFFSV